MIYTYHCQVHADNRKRRIVLMPTDCNIRQEYLNGCSNQEFITAFRELQNIGIAVYDDMI